MKQLEGERWGGENKGENGHFPIIPGTGAKRDKAVEDVSGASAESMCHFRFLSLRMVQTASRGRGLVLSACWKAKGPYASCWTTFQRPILGLGKGRNTEPRDANIAVLVSPLGRRERGGLGDRARRAHRSRLFSFSYRRVGSFFFQREKMKRKK